jgi:two-component system cell cycle sensor histidine kinase/response regulator CckA
MKNFETSNELRCTHDLDGTILSVNRAAARALRVDTKAMVGKTINDFLSPIARGAFAGYIETILRDGVAGGTMELSREDGTLLTWEYHNVLQRRGPKMVVRGYARDVSDREEVLRELRASEKRFRSIIENISDVIAIIEPTGRISYASPSLLSVLGHKPQEMIGRSICDLVYRDDVAHAAGFFDGLCSGGTPSEPVELRFRHANGSIRFVEVVARNIACSGATCVIATARDVTERRKLQEQLQAANRMVSLGRLAAIVAHEFNNVLMSMQPFADLLQRTAPSPEVIARSAWHISNSVARGKRIAQDILRYTQPAEPALAAIDVSKWWDVLYPEIAALTANNIKIVTDFPREPLRVMGDAPQLAQAFGNLLTNARDAMPKGGDIIITARQPEPGTAFPFGVVGGPSFIHFSVADSGCGITPEVLPHVFEPLFTSKPNGTGLGLAITWHIVERHNGQIFVESTPGLGTTFHIFLPAAEAGAEETKLRHDDTPIRSRRLLMVDDEPAIMEGLSALLRDADFEVSCAATGEEALDVVDAFKPDIVLLDVGLPGIDGVETCRRLRKRQPALPVIFSSGHGVDARRDMDDRRTRYLQKPFDIDTLFDTIAALETEAAS